MTRLEALAVSYRLDPAALARLLEAVTGEDAPTAVSPADAVDLHLSDSLVALDLAEVRAAGTLADLGAGAGFPGLALAVALPRARVYLVESVGRKCDFLRRAADAAAVANVEVVHARAEEWSEGGEACDVVTARALAALPVVAEYAAPLLRPGGTLVAWKGRREEAEERDGAHAAGELGLEVVDVRRVEPFPGARDRHLHLLRKAAPTPDRFPRRPGRAAKRPLRAP
jgi:16S rRNA (guanine527-N7)-methyltransferase